MTSGMVRVTKLTPGSADPTARGVARPRLRRRDAAVQVAFGKRTLKPGFRFKAQGLKPGASKAMGQLESTCTAPPRGRRPWGCRSPSRRVDLVTWTERAVTCTMPRHQLLCWTIRHTRVEPLPGVGLVTRTMLGCRLIAVTGCRHLITRSVCYFTLVKWAKQRNE
jgi:hypothetical protein